MPIVVLLVAVAVIGAVAIVLAGRSGRQGEFEPDRPPFVLPEAPLVPADVDGVRFAVGLRGYRMDQVDVVMDRLAAELADRDRRIAELTADVDHDEREDIVLSTEDLDATEAVSADRLRAVEASRTGRIGADDNASADNAADARSTDSSASDDSATDARSTDA